MTLPNVTTRFHHSQHQHQHHHHHHYNPSIVLMKYHRRSEIPDKEFMSQTQDGGKDEEADFVAEEVADMALTIIEKIIGENPYSELKVQHWTTSIIERLLTELAKLKRPFKYIVNCSLQQRTGAGLHLASATYWDPVADGACTVKWDNDYVHCCVHVFGLQI